MNIKQIVNRISDPDKPRKGNFRLSLRKASIEGMDLCLERLTRRDPEFGIDFGHMHLYGISARVGDFTIDGQSIYTTIEAMSARERSGFVLDRFSGRFYLTNGALGFEDPGQLHVLQCLHRGAETGQIGPEHGHSQQEHHAPGQHQQGQIPAGRQGFVTDEAYHGKTLESSLPGKGPWRSRSVPPPGISR